MSYLKKMLETIGHCISKNHPKRPSFDFLQLPRFTAHGTKTLCKGCFQFAEETSIPFSENDDYELKTVT